MKQLKLVFLSIMLACLAGTVSASQFEDELAERLREAEQRLEEAARELAEINLQMHGDGLQQVFKFVHGDHPNRAMLGINIGRIEMRQHDGTTQRADGGADGVAVMGVTPGGPAAEAGLRAGDVLLQLNGERLAAGSEPPERRLQTLMDSVEPGETVSVRYRRGDTESSAQIVTRALDVHRLSPHDGLKFDFEMPDAGDMDLLIERVPFLSGLGQQRTWRGLELVELNPDLGRYFGTDKGLLVVRAPAEQRLGLQAGDVVQTIGGATPKSVPDAMRLLRFYQPGDKLVVAVMRDKRGKTLDVVVPDPEA